MALQQTSQAPVLKYYQARLVPAADAPEPAWRVAVVWARGKENVYWFAKKCLNVSLRQTTWDGRSLRLKTTHCYVYWPR